MQLPHGFDAVHARQLPVDHQQVETARIPRQRRQGGLGRFRQRHVEAQRLEHAAEDFARGRVVVHDQCTQSVRRATFRRRRRQRAGAIETRREPETAATPGFAVAADLAIHQLDQALADRQAQAHAAMLARIRLVHLGERIEQPRQDLRIDADAGVAHFETQAHRIRVGIDQTDFDHDLAALGELERVRHQVDQQLLQSRRSAPQCARHVGFDREQHFQPFFARAFADHRRQVGEQVVQQEIGLLDTQLARFDARQVEHIVDQAQQQPGRRAQLRQQAALARVKRRAFEQGRHADDRVHRRADFVAHVRQELALGQVGRFGLVLGFLQLAPEYLFAPRQVALGLQAALALAFEQSQHRHQHAAQRGQQHGDEQAEHRQLPTHVVAEAAEEIAADVEGRRADRLAGIAMQELGFDAECTRRLRRQGAIETAGSRIDRSVIELKADAGEKRRVLLRIVQQQQTIHRFVEPAFASGRRVLRQGGGQQHGLRLRQHLRLLLPLGLQARLQPVRPIQHQRAFHDQRQQQEGQRDEQGCATHKRRPRTAARTREDDARPIRTPPRRLGGGANSKRRRRSGVIIGILPEWLASA